MIKNNKMLFNLRIWIAIASFIFILKTKWYINSIILIEKNFVNSQHH